MESMDRIVAGSLTWEEVCKGREEGGNLGVRSGGLSLEGGCEL